MEGKGNRYLIVGPQANPEAPGEGGAALELLGWVREAGMMWEVLGLPRAGTALHPFPLQRLGLEPAG